MFELKNLAFFRQKPSEMLTASSFELELYELSPRSEEFHRAKRAHVYGVMLAMVHVYAYASLFGTEEEVQNAKEMHAKLKEWVDAGIY